MLTIQIITSTGAVVNIEGVERFRFLQECQYDGADFWTKWQDDVRQRTCCDSHRVMHYRKVILSERIYG